MKIGKIVDLYSGGEFHQIINASILLLASYFFDKVEYFGHSSSCESLKNFISRLDTAEKNNIIYIKKNNKVKFNGKLSIFRKSVYCSIWSLYCYIKGNKNDVFIINQNIAPLLHPLNIISKFKKNKVIIFCHSELELVLSHQKNISISEKIIRCIFRNFFIKRKISPYLKFVLLGDNMAQLFLANISEQNRKAIFSIDHPYIRPQMNIENIENIENNILTNLPPQITKIGIIGMVNKKRGLNELITLLNKIKGKSVAKIFSISYIESEIKLEDLGLIQLNKTTTLLPSIQYGNYVNKMDYILFTYPIDSYKLTASGAILEAIWWQKPIIALKNEYFNYLFSKYGELGILCDSVDELAKIIINIKSCFQPRISLYKKNLANARLSLLPQNVYKQVDNIQLFN